MSEVVNSDIIKGIRQVKIDSKKIEELSKLNPQACKELVFHYKLMNKFLQSGDEEKTILRYRNYTIVLSSI